MRDVAVPLRGFFQAGRQRLRRSVPSNVKAMFRRAEHLLPNREAREYERWRVMHLKRRAALYKEPLEPGLLSILTPVWDGSPVRYLDTLANSLIAQNREGACEWVLLDNGCSNSAVQSYLEQMRQYRWIKLRRSDRNLGIIGGLRCCLGYASARYVLPVDADDYLYTDALQVITSCVRRNGYPPLLYTDEDKIVGSKFYEPYFKPDWDPVLFLNSAYIAHLGVIDRDKALELGAYTDPATEGSPDWDVFMRFMLAGHSVIHIPEVVYSWRSHAHSTADDSTNKPYVDASQRAVLRRFLDTHAEGMKFAIERNPLFPGGAHWRFARQQGNPKPFVCVVLCANSTGVISTLKYDGRACDPEMRTVFLDVTSSPQALLPIARELASQKRFLQLVGRDVANENRQSQCEASGLLELHPDAVMIGGRVLTSRGKITEAGRYFGFRGACGSPDHGRSSQDAGYFAQMWKQRSVSAVSTQLAVVDPDFLIEVLSDLPPEASIGFLGAWAGAHAFRTGRRIIYSPFLSGISDFDWETLATSAEQRLFLERNSDLIPDHRFYSRYFSLEESFALRYSQEVASCVLN